MAITVSKPFESLLRGELLGVKATIALVFLSLVVAAYLRLNVPPYRGLPLYGRDKAAWTNLQAEKLWFMHAKRVMDEGLKKVRGFDLRKASKRAGHRCRIEKRERHPLANSCVLSASSSRAPSRSSRMAS